MTERCAPDPKYLLQKIESLPNDLLGIKNHRIRDQSVEVANTIYCYLTPLLPYLGSILPTDTTNYGPELYYHAISCSKKVASTMLSYLGNNTVYVVEGKNKMACTLFDLSKKEVYPLVLKMTALPNSASKRDRSLLQISKLESIPLELRSEMVDDARDKISRGG